MSVEHSSDQKNRSERHGSRRGRKALGAVMLILALVNLAIAMQLDTTAIIEGKRVLLADGVARWGVTLLFLISALGFLRGSSGERAVQELLKHMKKEEPNQPVQPTPGTGSVSNFESPARRG